MLLATPWSPSSELLGPSLFWALALVLGYPALLRCTRWRALLFAAPLVFTVGAALNQAFPWSARRFPDLADFAAFYLLITAAGLFSLDLARSGTLAGFVCGSLALLPLGALLSLDAACRFTDLVAANGASFWGLPDNLPEPRIVLLALVFWCVLYGVLVRRAMRPWRTARRLALGLCSGCGYNLTANISGVCPECGTAVAAFEER
jgi:hypothetical protein